MKTKYAHNQKLINKLYGRNFKLESLISEASDAPEGLDPILFTDSAAKVREIQEIIRVPNPTGSWSRDKTDIYWQKWVASNIDELVDLGKSIPRDPDQSDQRSRDYLNKADIEKVKSNAASLAALVLNDPEKKNLDGVLDMCNHINHITKYPNESVKFKGMTLGESRGSLYRKRYHGRY